MQPADSKRPSIPVADECSDSNAIGNDPPADALESLVPGWERELLPEFLDEVRDHIATAEASLLLLETNPDDSESIHTVLRAFHTIKGSAGLVRLSSIETLAHHAESLLIRARDGGVRLTHESVDLALRSCDAIKSMFDDTEAFSSGREPPLPESVETLLDALDAAEMPEVSAKLVMVGRQPNAGAAGALARKADESWRSSDHDTQSTAASPDESDSTVEAQSLSTPGSVRNATIRVNMKRLDDLVNLVGELVIAHSIFAQDASTAGGDHGDLARDAARTGKIVRQLQDLAMGLRMVPFTGTFHRMSRLARDLAHKSGKSIHFHASGDQTEIDRNMVQVLNDPLIHMIRNAVDHGIEPAEERVGRGKNPVGSLHLEAYHAGGNVVIELRDDGRGLDRDAVVHRAVECGVVEPDRDLSDADVASLVFHPGLSTSDRVTDVSGRGVGMDVVRRNVEFVRGNVTVTSQPGRGTTIRLCVPLTMAILDAMLLRVGQHQYLLPTVAIQRSFRPKRSDLSTVGGRAEIVTYHERLYPLFRLHELFGVEGAVGDPTQAIVLVIEGTGKRCALMVDEILGQRQVVIKSLGRVLADVQGVAGGAVLGNGRVGIILDATSLVQLAHAAMPRTLPSAMVAPS